MYFISGDSDRCKQGVIMMVEVMSPVSVRYFLPAISAPPEDSFSDVAPSPAQVMSSSDEPEASHGPDSSDLVSVSGIAVVLGLGFAVLSV
ncbi:hypothetical protein Hdeb2414_s0020g00563291 [Helianthus debilis subsp. tardiflorus]